MSLHAELIAEMQQFCATRPRQSLLRQMIERWIRALASVDTEQRAAFEAGATALAITREIAEMQAMYPGDDYCRFCLGASDWHGIIKHEAKCLYTRCVDLHARR